MIAQLPSITSNKQAISSRNISRQSATLAQSAIEQFTGYVHRKTSTPANAKAEQPTTAEQITVRLATAQDSIFAEQITEEMCSSAFARGCGISRRSPADIQAKMQEGKAIIALTMQNEWVGFSYMETYENNQYVSNSGLIVAPAFRNCGIAWTIKQRVFELSRKMYPDAKVFSITTGGAVMKMNSRLGFEPVTFGEITKEKRFWEGCKSCVNYQTLCGKNFKNCFCTAMLYNPDEESQEDENELESEHFK